MRLHKRWGIALFLLMTTACNGKVLTEPQQSMSGELAQRDSRIKELEEQVRVLTERVTAMKVARTEDAPPAFYRAVAYYVFQEFKNGTPPLDLIGGETFGFGVTENGHSTYRQVSNKEDIDFGPLLQWFREHQNAEIETVVLDPRSSARLHMKLAGGYTVIVVFRAFHLVAFSVHDHLVTFE